VEIAPSRGTDHLRQLLRLAAMADAPVTGVIAAVSNIVYYAVYPVYLLSYISYPIVALFRFIALVLAPFWSIAQFILLPVTYIAYGISYAVTLPFRLQLLERFEVSISTS
jgi:hypothetical protein